MKLMHYSDRRVKKIRSTANPARFDPRWPLGKPRGFWVSVDDDPESSWKGWCEGEGFHLSALAYEHQVTLKPTAKILYIRTALELQQFSDKYSSPDTIGGHKHPSGSMRLDDGYPKFVYDIKWWEVAKLYQGIIIAPYIWECRLKPEYTWYYGWDCASGCIWDAAAIESIDLLKVNEKYKTYQEKTHRETMQQLRDSVAKIAETLPDFGPLVAEVDTILATDAGTPDLKELQDVKD